MKKIEFVTNHIAVLDNVLSVYSGRSGCSCGCRGKHNDSQIAIKRKLTTFHKLPDDFEIDVCLPHYVAWETGIDRVQIIYLKKDEVKNESI